MSEPKHAMDTPAETAPQAETATEEDDGYTPVFSRRFRTVIYVLGVVWSVAAIVLAILSTDLSWPKWTADLIAGLGPVMPGISAAFGVRYAGVEK